MSIESASALIDLDESWSNARALSRVSAIYAGGIVLRICIEQTP